MVVNAQLDGPLDDKDGTKECLLTLHEQAAFIAAHHSTLPRQA